MAQFKATSNSVQACQFRRMKAYFGQIVKWAQVNDSKNFRDHLTYTQPFLIVKLNILKSTSYENGIKLPTFLK
jgi:hypothetical protein